MNTRFIFLAKLSAMLVLAQAAVAIPPEMAVYDPSKQIRFSTPAHAEAKRQELIHFIWADGLPSNTLPTVTRNIAADVFDRYLPGIERKSVTAVDKLDADIAPYDFHSVSYLLHPLKTNVNTGNLVIYHSGHRRSVDEWAGGDDVINRLLGEGFTVLVMDMPFYGWNADDTIKLPEGRVTITREKRENPHEEMFKKFLPKLPNEGAIFRFFLEPVVQGINYFLQTKPGAEVAMVGISGGGWAATLAPAVDMRIKRSFPVAGTYPLYCRTKPFPTFSHDIEQYYDPLYREIDSDGDGITDTAAGVASWLEIYTLGAFGPGRRQVQILNYNDTCCFFGDAFKTYSNFVPGVVRKLDQGEWGFYSDANDRHWISSNVIHQVIEPALMGTAGISNSRDTAARPPVTPWSLTPEQWQKQANVPDEIAPIAAPFPMPQLKRPVFPNRSFSIADFGAVADGRTKNTAAIAEAIAACSKAGGGKVIVPAGRWLTGPIRLQSNIHLYLSEGATLLFSQDFKDYLPVVFVRWAGHECYNFSPFIYARDCENIAITGPGKLDGQGQPWWNWVGDKEEEATRKIYNAEENGIPVRDRVFGIEGYGLRPEFISPIGCTNVLFEGFTLVDGPFWSVNPVYCQNVIARNLKIITRHANGDGVNANSCRNMLIEHCYFQTDDDAVAIKSGMNADGRRVNKPCENIVVRHIYSKGPRWGSISIGSDMSGGVKNVLIQDVRFDETLLGFQIKSAPRRGGYVEDVWVEDVRARNLNWSLFYINANYTAEPKAAKPSPVAPPRVRNIHLKNLAGSQIASPNRPPIVIEGFPDKPVEQITFEDVECSGQDGVALRHVRNATLRRVTVNQRSGPAIRGEDVRDLVIEDAKSSRDEDVLLEVNGPQSRNIVLKTGTPSPSKQRIVLGCGVSPDAVR
ncbi:MAG: glycoside hydrolase family 28 protein [Verrucomicrobia bacterium]|nr:glycoside hydrolase family 28 protein [Verrucomicrobiota bacterium]